MYLRRISKIAKNQFSQSIQNIETSLKKIKVQSVAPVESWNPQFCGNLDIRILKDGSWFYEGSKINRTNLVKLFSSILKKEENKYFLVTPIEKVGIQVDFAPFVAISLDLVGNGKSQIISFTTNVGDNFDLNYEHGVRVDYNTETGEPHPYVLVRQNLEALIDRKNFYRLIDLGTVEKYKGQDWFGVWSSNCFFPIIKNKYLQQ